MSKVLSRQQSRLLAMTAVGGFLEFYDFIIYALMAGYLAEHFFPAAQPRVALLAAFSTFASGYLVRPIGGLVFGHLGDRKGRKKTFSATILIMAISTGLVGCLPGHNTIGLLAPVLLVVFRLLQGLALGGEIPGAITYISESVPERQGLVISIVFMALMCGAVFGSLVHVLLGAVLGEQALHEWGWRLAFILGGCVGILGYYVRRNFRESQAFREMLANRKQEKMPAKILIQNYSGKIFQGMAFILPAAVVMCLVFLFLPSWLVKVMSFDPDMVRWATLGGLTVGAVCTLLWGDLADSCSQRTVGMSLGLSLVITTLPLVMLILAGHYFYIAGALLFGVVIGMTAGFGPILLARLFPVSIRYSGIALSYNLAFAIVGGLVPVIAMGLMETLGELYGIALLPVISGAVVLLALTTFKADREAASSLSAE